MSAHILFTKSYPTHQLEKLLDSSYQIESLDFIATELVDIQEIKKQIPKQARHFIVTSLRATEHIESLNLQGNFYCVGTKSESYLKRHNKNVVFTTGDAATFLKTLEKQVPQKKQFVYFCSNLRKDQLPHGVRHLGHDYKEVITYKITSKRTKINQPYDAYVFFSPSGVKSFTEQYDIPKKAIIFAIGETTGKEVYALLKKEALTPAYPNLESLIKTIKAYFDAKK